MPTNGFTQETLKATSQLRSATTNLRFTQRGPAARWLRCRWFTPNSKYAQ
jgi:hypothetical protein